MPGLLHDWNAEALAQALQAWAPGIGVEVCAELDSTSSVLLADAVDERRPRLLVAERQTAGRGRNGRPWQSAPRASLTFSLALQMAPVDWSGLSLAVGVAVAQALEPDAAAPRLVLKWPNDLWLRDDAMATGGRKLGGILIETRGAGPVRRAVIGIGLNVRAADHDAAQLSHGYACLGELRDTTIGELAAPLVLARIAPALLQATAAFDRDGFGPFAGAFARRDLLRGRGVSTSLPDCPQGTALGVDAQGALRVHDGRREHRVVGGEVSVRPRAEGMGEGPC